MAAIVGCEALVRQRDPDSARLLKSGDERGLIELIHIILGPRYSFRRRRTKRKDSDPTRAPLPRTMEQARDKLRLNATVAVNLHRRKARVGPMAFGKCLAPSVGMM